MYTYMYNGGYIKDLNEKSLKSYTKDGKVIHYYDFEYIKINLQMIHRMIDMSMIAVYPDLW